MPLLAPPALERQSTGVILKVARIQVHAASGKSVNTAGKRRNQRVLLNNATPKIVLRNIKSNAPSYYSSLIEKQQNFLEVQIVKRKNSFLLSGEATFGESDTTTENPSPNEPSIVNSTQDAQNETLTSSTKETDSMTGSTASPMTTEMDNTTAALNETKSIQRNTRATVTVGSTLAMNDTDVSHGFTDGTEATSPDVNETMSTTVIASTPRTMTEGSNGTSSSSQPEASSSPSTISVSESSGSPLTSVAPLPPEEPYPGSSGVTFYLECHLNDVFDPLFAVSSSEKYLAYIHAFLRTVSMNDVNVLLIVFHGAALPLQVFAMLNSDIGYEVIAIKIVSLR